MMRTLTNLSILALIGMLGDTTLERFVSTVDCGFVARVESVVQLSESAARTRHRLGEEYVGFVILATFSVLDTFGLEECKDIPTRLEMFFSMEVHSSHPMKNETVVLFPRRKGEEWFEAVYGRSYWILSKSEQGWNVEVNWRNRFLLEPLDLQSMETATVPLSAVVRVFEESRIAMSHARVITPSLVERTIRNLESEKSEVRIHAVRTLALFPGMSQRVEDGVTRLIRLLENDPDPTVRAEVAYALAEMVDPITSYSELVHGLAGDVCGTRQAVAFLFGRRNLLLNLNPDLRGRVIEILKSMTRQPSCPGERVMAAYALLSSNFREHASEAYFSTIVESAERLLFQIITVPDAFGLRSAQYARVLAALDAGEAMRVTDRLIAMTKSDNKTIAANSAQVLNEFGECFGGDLLATARQRCLESVEECTKALNTLAFFSLGDEAAASFLQEKLSSCDENLVLAAIAALRSMGEAGKLAVPRLFDLVESENSQVRRAAAWAIVDVSPESIGTVASRVRKTDRALTVELLRKRLRGML